MKFLTRLFKPAQWHNLRTLKPLSRVFGFDRGTPIDRYYIEKFLSANSKYIKGRALEIGTSEYITKFGTGVTNKEVLHYTADNSSATIIGDLTKIETLPSDQMDCFICTQTFNFIYDFKSAIRGAHHLLKKDGILLATLAGVCQISRYDMNRWGDYWRFTTRSAEEAFGEVFGKDNVIVQSFGNVLSSVSLLHGISSDELSHDELDHQDADYQIIITVVAKKC
jgi:hypothetical protein